MRPLEGLKILDFTHVLAGPFATRTLADMGADIVKINTVSRGGVNGPNNPYFVIWNRNKRTLALNVQVDGAIPVCKELINQADVVIDNFSLGVLDRWGVGYETMSKSNEGVVYVQMSGLGAGGPQSHYVTYAPTIHAMAGLTYLTGVEGREDIGIGFSYLDHLAGLHAAIAILSAIEDRNQTGIGQKVDMAQFEVGANLIGPTLFDYFANGVVASPKGNKQPYDCIAPHGCYQCYSTSKETKDERWIAIVCETEEQWLSLRKLMGEPEWASGDKFQSAEARWQNSEELDTHISNWTKDQDSNELMYRLQAAGVPAGVVQTSEDMVESDPQLRVTDFLRPAEGLHPTMGHTFADRLPLYFEKTPCDDYQRSRVLGEDNQEILKDWLGYSTEEIKRGEASGIYE
ncbi:MAG: CoA transferase [Gammaproteobacteria bacterium]|nr:CoA transferase [Gammaproteobacteria bacterium]